MKTFILTLLAMMLSVSVYAQRGGSDLEIPHISVTGEALVNVVPDKIVITFGIETHAMEMDDAKDENGDILRDAISDIRRMGVKDKDIQTDHLSIEPRYRNGFGKEDFLGYFVRNSIAVTITDPARVDELVSEVLDAGVNYIHGIDFQTTELKTHRERAREMALAAAREKAEKMAAALGQRIARPLQISEQHMGSPWGYWSGWGRGRSSGMSQNVMQNISSGGDITGTVALGKIGIRAAVRVTFVLTN